MSLNEELIEDPLKALDKIADYLARRDHSEKELITKLSRKYSASAIANAVDQAKQNHWLTDPEELAQRVAESLHRKNKGHLYICSYLSEKGLPQINRSAEKELEKAQEFIQNRLQTLELDCEQKQKATGWLQSRGFDSETISQVIYF